MILHFTLLWQKMAMGVVETAFFSGIPALFPNILKPGLVTYTLVPIFAVLFAVCQNQHRKGVKGEGANES